MWSNFPHCIFPCSPPIRNQTTQQPHSSKRNNSIDAVGSDCDWNRYMFAIRYGNLAAYEMWNWVYVQLQLQLQLQVALALPGIHMLWLQEDKEKKYLVRICFLQAD